MRRLSILSVVGALLAAACGPSGAQVSAQKTEDLAAAEAYMLKNAKAPGVVTLPSGLQYRIVRSGPANGPHPKLADEVKIHYEGKLVDGTVFDSSYERGLPENMPIRGVIMGWQEVVPLMRPGDEWIVTIPPKLGYGERRAGQIPPNSVLIFRMELIDILSNPQIGRG